MIRVLCANGHATTKQNQDHWRHQRACDRCGQPTLYDYSTACSHPAWRYPNPLPVDGDVCPDCNKEHVEPKRDMSESELERLRGIAMILATLFEEEEGIYTRREATTRLRDLCAAHGFTYTRRPQ